MTKDFSWVEEAEADAEKAEKTPGHLNININMDYIPGNDDTDPFIAQLLAMLLAGQGSPK